MVERQGTPLSVYSDVRDIIAESGQDSKVEVNQRALIDKVSTHPL